MITLLWNLFLAGGWVLMTEHVTWANFLIGFVLGYAILRFVYPCKEDTRYFPRKGLGDCVKKAVRAVGFIFYFLWEVLLSSVRVAYYVLTPFHNMKPAVLAIPLDVKTDGEILFLANLITLTPGTLSLEVSDDRQVLYIHAMYVDDPEELRNSIKKGFERQVIELLR